MSAPPTTDGPERTQAQKFQTTSTNEDNFRLILKVASEVLAFDDLQIYLCFDEDRSPLFWSYPKGYAEGEELSWNLNLVRPRMEHLAETSKKSRQGKERNENKESYRVMVAKVKTQTGSGHIALTRKHLGRFNCNESYLLEQLATLIEDSLSGNAESKKILWRLHIVFLHQKVLLRRLPKQKLFSAYLLKALHVCHGITPEMVGEGETERRWEESYHARATLKLPTDNGMSLRHEGIHSTDGKERDLDLNAHAYDLPVDKKAPESLAAKAAGQLRTIRTNEYQKESRKQLVFQNTQCHMTSPIIAGKVRCLGTLTVETTKEAAYSTSHEAALTLLAAHMSLPLQRAIKRFSPSKKVAEFSQSLEKIRSETSDDRLLEIFVESLQKLGYSSGIVSEVEYSQQIIRGVSFWGEDRMRRVKEVTERHLARDPKDCQVRAVHERKEQIIRNPLADESASQDAVVEGELKPFAIFPLLDEHDRAVWTVHVERTDLAPIGKLDVELIRELCSRVMKSREEARRTTLEREWLEKVLSNRFRDIEHMLQWFADFVVEEGVCVRCRVFLIDEKRKQTPFYEGGKHKTENFMNVELGTSDAHILQAIQPILFVRPRHKTHLQPSGEFGVILDAEDFHLTTLDNTERTQWVEIPARLGDRLFAKVVLDHNKAPWDAFTLDEMRLISRFKRTLSLAMESIRDQKATVQLCNIGITAHLLWHHLNNSTKQLLEVGRNLDQTGWLRRTNNMSDLLKRYHGLFLKLNTKEESISIKEELDFAKQILEPDFDGQHSGLASLRLEFKATSCTRKVPKLHRPLLLILMSLVINAREAVTKAGAELPEDRQPMPGQVTVEVVETGDNSYVRVSDNGTGFAPDKGAYVQDLFRNPSLVFSKGGRSGLVYAAMLADEIGWSLELTQSDNPTTIQLVVPQSNQKEG